VLRSVRILIQWKWTNNVFRCCLLKTGRAMKSCTSWGPCPQPQSVQDCGEINSVLLQNADAHYSSQNENTACHTAESAKSQSASGKPVTAMSPAVCFFLRHPVGRGGYCWATWAGGVARNSLVKLRGCKDYAVLLRQCFDASTRSTHQKLYAELWQVVIFPPESKCRTQFYYIRRFRLLSIFTSFCF